MNTPSPTPPHVLLEPTAQMRRWHTRLRRTLRPGSWTGVALVTPLAHVTNQSVDFQTYLYAVFHRHWASRAVHAVAMPLILAAALGVMATWSPALGWAAAAAVAASSLSVARSPGMALPAGLAALTALGCGALGQLWATAPLLGVGPLLGLVLLGAAQTLSHVVEPDGPPRVSGTDRWVPLRTFYSIAPVSRLVRSVAMLAAGFCNEVWASWRLLPVVLRDALWRAGWDGVGARRHAELLRAAMRDRNPAIDFVGSGGASDAAYRQ